MKKKLLLNLPEKKDIDCNKWSLGRLTVLAKAWSSQLDIDYELVSSVFDDVLNSSANYENIHEVECNFLDAFDYFFRDYVNWINDPRPSFYSKEIPF